MTSAGSRTIDTNDGSDIHTHKNLIGNMHEMRFSRHVLKSPQEVMSERSLRSRRSHVSRRSLRSNGSRRSQISNLEQIISHTILATASHGAKSAHFIVGQDLETIQETTSVDSILRDLDDISVMLENESLSVSSTFSVRRFSTKNAKLSRGLTPIISVDTESQSGGRDADLEMGRKDSVLAVTPDTSTETEHVSTDREQHAYDPFTLSAGESLESFRRIFPRRESFDSASHPPTPPRSMPRTVPVVKLEDDSFDVFGWPKFADSEGWTRVDGPSSDWTTFGSNPFAAKSFSSASPTGVADFGKRNPARATLHDGVSKANYFARLSI